MVDKLLDGLKDGVLDNVKDSMLDGVTDGLKDGLTGGMKDGMLGSVKNSLAGGAKGGMLDGMKGSMLDGMKSGALDSAKHGAMDGMKDGVLRDVTGKMLDGAQGGMLGGPKEGMLGRMKDGMLGGASDGLRQGAKARLRDSIESKMPGGMQGAVLEQVSSKALGKMDGWVDGAMDGLEARLASFLSGTRVHSLEGPAGFPAAVVLEWTGEDALSELSEIQVDVMSTDADLDIEPFLGERASLVTRLADGDETRRTGLVSEIAALEADGGAMRYRITLVPWLWALTQTVQNRSWQEKNVLEIVEDVFAAYTAVGAWKISEEVAGFLADERVYSFCAQYNESDYDFVRRLLAEEGLGFYFVEDEKAPSGHAVVIFADSTLLPEDPSSAAGNGIRFHRSAGTEESDTIQQLSGESELAGTRVTYLSYDYKATASVAGSATSILPLGEGQDVLEQYEWSGAYAYASSAEAERYATFRMQALECRARALAGFGGVRTFRSGTKFRLTQQVGEDAGPYVLTRVRHWGVNPQPVSKRGKGAAGAIDLTGEQDPLRVGAAARGYAQSFEVVREAQPWRPLNRTEHGLSGCQTAIVVGPNGGARATAGEEVHVDGLGRIQVSLHWQQNETAWVRVAQRQAGDGGGTQFVPRVGQEVLVKFLDHDVSRPLVVGALYNGQGEGGQKRTPAGQRVAADAGASLYAEAKDLVGSAQGNVVGGNSPAWHGLGGDGHSNSAALLGFKTQELGGTGCNQLMFDDTDQQQRVHLGTTQAATQLNLGHLVHPADNHRGSFRGEGFELRTDAYGTLRGEQGLLLTTYRISGDEPAGDPGGGAALLKQASQLSGQFSQAAQTHQTVSLSGSEGSASRGNSVLDKERAPIPALLQATQGMVSGVKHTEAVSDAQKKQTTVEDGKLPQTNGSLISMHAKGGLAAVAGQDLQVAAGEVATFASGGPLSAAVGGALRVQSGQAIGMLAGAQSAGDGDRGFTLIAGQGPLDVQAQSDVLNLAAQGQVKLSSANTQAVFAAAKSIVISTAEGASVTITGGNITFACPGKLTVHAAKKEFLGPEQLEQSFTMFPAAMALPAFPGKVCVECLLAARDQAAALAAR